MVDNLLSLFEKIRSQADLEKVLEEEIGKLEVKVPIKAVFHERNLGFAERDVDGYEVHIGGVFSLRYTVRHELYHIHKGHCDFSIDTGNVLLEYQNSIPYLIYLKCIQELQAILYGAFGLRL